MGRFTWSEGRRGATMEMKRNEKEKLYMKHRTNGKYEIIPPTPLSIYTMWCCFRCRCCHVERAVSVFLAAFAKDYYFTQVSVRSACQPRVLNSKSKSSANAKTHRHTRCYRKLFEVAYETSRRNEVTWKVFVSQSDRINSQMPWTCSVW